MLNNVFMKIVQFFVKCGKNTVGNRQVTAGNTAH